MGSYEKPSSFLDAAPYIPPDAIFEVTKNYLADKDPKKVNVGAGTYRDENGKPWILPSVRMAKEQIAGADHEYPPIAGLKSFRDNASKLVFHDTAALREGRVATCQSLSGTGALFLAGGALKKANPSIKTVYISDPTWPNHELLFSSLGFDVQTLPYYKDGAFDYDGYISALKNAEVGSIIILHTVAHNPTGCDPSREQWKVIAEIMQQRRLFPILDSAYLGFNSGNVDEDAWAIRYFVEELKLEVSVCLSFAKNMGLYGERTGLVAFVTNSPATTRNMESLLENAMRASISCPPAYGARIADAVLSTPEIAKQWAQDLITMSSRVKHMRQRLYDELVKLQTPGDWSHIIKQSGMFGYTGISPKQIVYITETYHVYLANTSRISIAGLNEGNVEYFAYAIDQTVRTIKE